MKQLKLTFILLKWRHYFIQKHAWSFFRREVSARVGRLPNLTKNIGNPKLEKPTTRSYRSSIPAMINIPVASISQLCAAFAGLQVVLCVLLYTVPGQHKVAWTPKSCNSSQRLLWWLLQVTKNKQNQTLQHLQNKQVSSMKVNQICKKT